MNVTNCRLLSGQFSKMIEQVAIRFLIPSDRTSQIHRGRSGFPASSPSRNKAYNATTLQKPPPYIPWTRKRTSATGTRGPPYTPKPASTSTSSTTSAYQGD